MNFKNIPLLLLLLLVLSSWNTLFSKQTSYDEKFDSEVKKFAENSGLTSAQWGLSVFSIESEQEVYSYNSNKALIPASTLKAITTATALMKLGKDYYYETKLMHSGYVDRKGNLIGNVYIIGAGDPSFAAGRMNDSLALEYVLNYFYNAIFEAGIKRINGSIISDTRVFDSEMASPKWLWEDVGNYFGAGTSGLSVNENEYSVFFKASDKIGGPTEVVNVEPPVMGMILHNEVTTAEPGSGDNVYIYGAPYSNDRRLTGTIPHGVDSFEVRGSMPDPALFLSNILHLYLQNKGIEIIGDAKALHYNVNNMLIDNEGLTAIASWNSPDLEQIAYRTNMASVNSYAESLLKTIAYEKSSLGTTQEGIKIMLEYWSSRGVDIKGVRLHDGSGLSPSNRISAATMAHILAKIAVDDIFDSFIKGLPVAGQSGSLRNALRGTSSENNLAAKSGFLSNVRAFTGYTTTKNGRKLAFSFIVNDFDGTHAQLRILMNSLMHSITESDL